MSTKLLALGLATAIAFLACSDTTENPIDPASQPTLDVAADVLMGINPAVNAEQADVLDDIPCVVGLVDGFPVTFLEPLEELPLRRFMFRDGGQDLPEDLFRPLRIVQGFLMKAGDLHEGVRPAVRPHLLIAVGLGPQECDQFFPRVRPRQARGISLVL